ncbi:MAG TPA: hypothetical protein VMH02_00105 [Verrucomicrobiae bacterium]|nr:hypothetical protein [Verrucomicrobiae bacterium]
MNQNPTTRAQRRYFLTFAIAMAAYAAVLVASVTLVDRFEPHGIARYALLLAPLLPVAFIFLGAVRYLRDTDEFERRVATESLAAAAGVTAAFSVTYGFLESTGLPPLSAWWTWSVLMCTWLVARLVLNRRYR